MSKRFLSGINVTGTATLNTVADAGSNTDKFLVLDSSNNVSYRTAAELYADLGIGATAAAYTSTLKHEVKASQAISKGQAVYVSSADGTNMIVSKASNVSEGTSSKTMGLLEVSLSTNGKGNVITEGLLSGLNTSSAAAGDPVWLGVDGALIFGLTNKPYAPAHLVFIGIVTRANANNGEIFVKVQNGFEMNELHNYAEGSVQNNQVIVYESATSLYKPKTIPTILGYTPVTNARTLTINGTSYDLSADRSWTITTDASARSILRYVATANQTTFTISGGYTPGLTDVYRNGVKLDNTTDFTATNGTTIVLTNGASVNDVIEVYRYQTAFLANNTLRVVTEFTATAGQTTFNVIYNSGLVDVFYNGSKLLSTEYAAGNGTTIVLNFPCNLNDTLEVHAYSYAAGAFAGAQAQLNGTGFVKANGTTITYDNSTYLTSINSSQVTTALGFTPYNATNPSGYITSSALSSYLPLSGGTLTGALNGTSAIFTQSGTTTVSVNATGNTSYSAFIHAENGVNKTYLEYINSAYADSSRRNYFEVFNTVGGVSIWTNSIKALDINTSQAATFSSSATATEFLVTSGAPRITFTANAYGGSYKTILGTRSGAEGVLQLGNNGPNFIVGGNTGTSGALHFYVNATSDFITSTNGTLALVLASTGAATFSSSVNTGSWLGVPNGFGITGRNAANTAGRILIMINSGNQIEIGRDTDISQIRMGTASASDAMTITSGGNILINSTSDIGTKLQVNGANYIEMATFACTAAAASTIQTDNQGYVQFSYGDARHCSNTGLFVPVTNGIQITKSGIVHVTFSQDITTSGTSGYVAAYIRKNGANISENLITNTGSQWDGVNGVGTISVNSGDVIGFFFSAADILSFDPGSWSQYSFIWSSR